jgi:methyltransferase (TIGR00027 family)
VDPARPSRTALRVALRRAAHQLFDAHPLVFQDPLAVRILGAYADELQRTPGRFEQFKPRPHSIALRATIVARSRYAEDLLARAVASGVTQYVILGAGLDTFAHRNPYPPLRVFEVDHPATQAWKRDLIHTTGLPDPERLAYVSVDFEMQSLAGQLESAGFDASAPAYFSWLGVVPYLTLTAFRETLAFIAARPSGSAVVFDYGQPRSVLAPVEQLEHDSLTSRLKLAGESFQLFFTPPEVASELQSFESIEDLGSADLNARYFADRSDSLRLLGSASRIVSAWV